MAKLCFEPTHLPLLQHAQQLHLQVDRHLGDLVEEQGAAGGLANQALARAHGARVRALGMAEELGLQQVVRNRAAVDRHERALGAAAAVVDRLRDELLAGAALAGDEHVGIGVGDAVDHVVHAADAVALADQLAAAEHALEAALEHGVLLAHAQLVHGPLDREQEVVVVEGLDDVVGGAGAQRLDCALDRGEAGHQDDRRVLVALAQRADDVDAAHVGQPQVADDEVEVLVARAVEAVGAAADELAGVTGHAQHALHAFADAGVVVDHQHALVALLKSEGGMVHGPRLHSGSSM